MVVGCRELLWAEKNTEENWDRGCGTVVEIKLREQEVVDSNPVGAHSLFLAFN